MPEQDNINNISTVTIIVNDDGSIRKAQHYNIVCKVIDQLLYILIKLPTVCTLNIISTVITAVSAGSSQRRELAAVRALVG